MKNDRYVKPQMTVDELSNELFRINLLLEQTNTRLEQTNSELEEANRKLAMQEKARSEMFANISHDLRSPVAAVRSSIEYLQSLESYDKNEFDTYLELVRSRTVGLEVMINDIFLLNSLDVNAVSYDFEPIGIGMFLEDFFFSCEADRKYASRRLELEVPESFDHRVSIDVHRFTRVLDNLFTNALKYSGEGDAIILNAELECPAQVKNPAAEDSTKDGSAKDGSAKDRSMEDGSTEDGSAKDGSTIRIRVMNEGPGIDGDKLSHIFERTYRASSARTPGDAPGAGLGLAIAKSIVEQHGGSISCSCTENTREGAKKGSRMTVFEILLPVVAG